MIKGFKSFAIAAAAALAIVPAGASAGDGTQGNLVSAAMNSKNHQTLVAAVKAAGLVDTLASGGPFTVFAPTDAAFARLPAGTVDTLLQPANRDQLRAVLTYHVVPGKVTSKDLVEAIRENGGRATLTTVQGGTITATMAGSSVAIIDAAGGSAMVTMADLVQSNGVIHVTDAVSLPM
jgi:uncharacterized surface protein with fasciclin (FAS1) repeats